jgi:16S rRNA (uracil1498-N3)-methyltransferase
MRLGAGRAVALFNGRDGEWRPRWKRPASAAVLLDVRRRPLQRPPDLWLLFAPIKKARTDFIVEKAPRWARARICRCRPTSPMPNGIRRDRLQAHAVEAAEQCGGTFVPEVADLQRLDRLLADWPADRRLMFCDEARAGAGAPLESAEPGPGRS